MSTHTYSDVNTNSQTDEYYDQRGPHPLPDEHDPSAPPLEDTSNDDSNDPQQPDAFTYQSELEDEEEDIRAESTVTDLQMDIIKQNEEATAEQIRLLEEGKKQRLQMFLMLNKRQSENKQMAKINKKKIELEAQEIDRELSRNVKQTQSERDMENLCRRYARKEVKKMNSVDRKLRDSLNANQPLTDFNATADLDQFFDASDGAGPDDQPEATTKKKKKSKPHHSRLIRFDDDDLASNGTTCSSIFESDPVKSLKSKLQIALADATNVKENYLSESYMVTDAKDNIREVLRETEREAKNIKPTLQDEERISELIIDLKATRNELILAQGKLAKEAEERKLAPRGKLPSFDGEITNYFIFQESFDEATKYYSDKEKLTNYKLCLTGPKATFLLDLLASVTTYSEAVKVLEQEFAAESLIPKLQQDLAALPNTPRATMTESSNITKMLHFYNLLKIHNKVSSYAAQLIQLARKKVNLEHSNMLYNRHIEDDVNGVPGDRRVKPFIDYLVLLRRQNNMKIIENNYVHEYRQQKDNPPPPHLHNRQNTVTGSNMKCSICSNSHRTSSCPELQGKNNQERKRLLISKKKCFTCLQQYPHSSPSSCQPTYLHKKSNTVKSKLCPCDSKLNMYVCSCKTSNNRPPPNNVTPPPFNPNAPPVNLHAMTLPPPLVPGSTSSGP